jgi:hypothetical protein
MLDKLINLGIQVVADELEASAQSGTTPFDWNIIGLDKSRPSQTRSNGKTIHNSEHMKRKIDAVRKG